MHVVKLLKLVIQDFSEIGPNGPLFLDVGLHQVDVRAAGSDVVGDGAHLLHLVSQHAVEGHAGLKQAHLVASEADLPAERRSQARQLLVVRADSQFSVLGSELWTLLSIGSSEHL